MIATEVFVGERRGRLFSREPLQSSEVTAEFLLREYMDEEDQVREPALRELLRSPIVHVDIHPSVDPADVKQVFFRSSSAGQEPIFACAIVSGERLDQMVKETPIVYENFSLQVGPARHITMDGLTAAIEAWTERNYPDLALPIFLMAPWVDEFPNDLLEEIIKSPEIPSGDFIAPEDDFPAEVRPDVSRLVSAYEAA